MRNLVETSRGSHDNYVTQTPRRAEEAMTGPKWVVSDSLQLHSGLLLFSLNSSFHAFKQFFHSQLQQLVLPSRAEVPRRSYCFSIRSISVSLWLRKEVGPSFSTIAAQDCFTVTRTVVSNMVKYSSAMFEDRLWVRICSAAVTFIHAYIPVLPTQWSFCFNYSSWSMKGNRTWLKTAGNMQKRLQNFSFL